MLSHAVALEGDAMSVVNDPVENGVGDGRVCDQVMPSGHRDLGGDQGGLAPIAFLNVSNRWKRCWSVSEWVPKSSRMRSCTRVSLSIRR